MIIPEFPELPEKSLGFHIRAIQNKRHVLDTTDVTYPAKSVTTQVLALGAGDTYTGTSVSVLYLSVSRPVVVTTLVHGQVKAHVVNKVMLIDQPINGFTIKNTDSVPVRARLNWVDIDQSDVPPGPEPGDLAILQLSTLTINFGNVGIGEPATVIVRMTNVGQLPLTLFSIQSPTSVTVSPWPPLLEPGEHVDLTVTWDPVVSGSLQGSIQIFSNSMTSPDTISLQGQT